jgi:hypothetical protein
LGQNLEMKGTTERIRVFFLWLSVIERLLTDAERNSRHLVEDDHRDMPRSV